MIDVKDLKIGNIVYSKDAGWHGTDGVIVEINKRAIWIEKNGREYRLNDVSLEGIPITPEWLIKLGFTRNHQDGEFDHKDNENVIILCEDIGYTFDYDYGGIEWCQCGVEYVHQLQNFYYLTTGQELTIGGEV